MAPARAKDEDKGDKSAKPAEKTKKVDVSPGDEAQLDALQRQLEKMAVQLAQLTRQVDALAKGQAQAPPKRAEEKSDSGQRAKEEKPAAPKQQKLRTIERDGEIYVPLSALPPGLAKQFAEDHKQQLKQEKSEKKTEKQKMRGKDDDDDDDDDDD